MIPHQYGIGRPLGRGTRAIVREATHRNLETGEVYACKIINKNSSRARRIRCVFACEIGGHGCGWAEGQFVVR
ncbi:hypothetical protein K438DRAFT_1810181 [Mycena galopus ATCC 62051]|nr:hypothetical protein K438DRAFT_1810181 [Mycena galopus ATCC 62051]